jgi:hypothetical protein
MKVLVDISEEDIDRIRILLASRKISSVSEFVSLSIHNQMAIESGSSEIPTLESLLQSSPGPSRTSSKDEGREQDTRRLPSIKPVKAPKIADSFPFWGTQNKYLCLKQITLDFRRLAAEGKRPWIRYDIAMNRLLQEAVKTRKRLETVDLLLHRPRGEKLSTGFPKNDSKSLTRFEKQFIGGIDGSARHYGMAVMIGFLAAKKEEAQSRVEFGITGKGLEFSALDSPVFDKNESQILPSTPSLSDAEASFIISTLKEVKESEIDLMRFTLEYIVKGKKRPVDGGEPTKKYLDERYPNIAKEKKDQSFSVLEADTIRAGVISRLNELGLIKITRRGTKSEYQVTDLGRNFLKNLRRK